MKKKVCQSNKKIIIRLKGITTKNQAFVLHTSTMKKKENKKKNKKRKFESLCVLLSLECYLSISHT